MDPRQAVTGRTLETLLAAPITRLRLRASYALCQQMARYRAGNFYYSFLILPKLQRLAMCSLYAFMRVADDLADEEAIQVEKCRGLESWRCELESSLQGQIRLPLFHALVDTVKRFEIPPEYLFTLLEGVTSDLSIDRFATWEELRHYCYQVASVVGLCCIRIWGTKDPRTIPLAESAGIAFQLPSILRDIRPGAEAGRVYLPDEVLQASGCSRETILQGQWNESVRQAMAMVAHQAREEYRKAEPLQNYLPASGRAMWGIMMETYKGLLLKIENQGYLPGRELPRIGRWRKISLLFRAIPVRWGWKDTV